MSGICATWRQADPFKVGTTLAALAKGLATIETENVARQTDRNAGVAVSARFRTQQVYAGPAVLVACDADLCNEEELRAWSFEGSGLSGNKTAALIGALYEKFGCEFASKLRGSFSTVIWDRRQERLIAAVDPFGIKRLVYWGDGAGLMVASRIDALLQTGEVDTRINPPAIAQVLNYSSILGPQTIFRDVLRVPPGSMIIATENAMRLEKYWDMQYGSGEGGNEVALSRELESVVEKSVAELAKDGPFDRMGAFLSGGTDSSTVVGMMERLGRGRVKAFSIGFQEQPFNEMEYAAIAAKRFHAQHYTHFVGPGDCFEALPRMIHGFDEPFGNSSAIPTYFCAKLAAQNGVETLLAGDGGDELFGGNERYRTEQIFDLYHKMPRSLRRYLLEPVLERLPIRGGVVQRARGYVRRANMPGVERVLSYQFLATHHPAEVFCEDLREEMGEAGVFDIPKRYYEQAPAHNHLDRLLYVDVKITLGDSDLPKVTCMSEMAGVQTRYPFLERSVAEFSGRVPARLKVKRLEKRYLFKKAFRNLLPVEIIEKRKHGFGIPVALWLKSYQPLRELARDTLGSSRANQRGYFRREFLEELFQRHQADDSTYYGDLLWTFLVLELWHQRVVDRAAQVAV